jgi:AAA15 family ATPase/GTPase
MIRKFSVYNFKGFKDKIVFDLSKAREYNFNNNLVEDGIVKKGLVYGKNGTGKSNLGFAIYDLVIHLTDKQKPFFKYYQNYTNLDNSDKVAVFEYEFKFDNKIYTYTYGKLTPDLLAFEKLTEGNKVLIDFNFLDDKTRIVNILEASTLHIDLKDNRLSVLKYIYRNTPTNDNIISKIVRFAEGMLWFRCVDDGNNFIGLMNGSASMDDLIISNNKIKEFESFLKENDLNYHLTTRNFDGRNLLMASYEKGEATFSSVASTGTKALWLYYCWTLFFENVSFLYLDEFDAFYHYESSELVLKAIFNNPNFQAIVTSHNTSLMRNSITRPDTCFILTDNKIKSLSDCTDKEIREAHNLEKMYRNGTFTE